mmetsp:Transcript_22352/g.60411  ORF Transcript_22352/g.60411 Transcript_22352/m.60411 type:complete len:244 (+) Transcript_22352:1421-2152(+)
MLLTRGTGNPPRSLLHSRMSSRRPRQRRPRPRSASARSGARRRRRRPRPSWRRKRVRPPRTCVLHACRMTRMSWPLASRARRAWTCPSWMRRRAWRSCASSRRTLPIQRPDAAARQRRARRPWKSGWASTPARRPLSPQHLLQRAPPVRPRAATGAENHSRPRRSQSTSSATARLSVCRPTPKPCDNLRTAIPVLPSTSVTVCAGLASALRRQASTGWGASSGFVRGGSGSAAAARVAQTQRF